MSTQDKLAQARKSNDGATSMNKPVKTKTYKCHCGKNFVAKVADRRRGWAQSCSKSCAAIKRERNLDRNNYANLTDKRRAEYPTFSNAHQFDNTELGAD